jgi:hypothetical protein
MNDREVLRTLGRAFLQEAQKVGTRALAHGVKSVFQDGRRAARGLERKLRQAVKTLDDITGPPDEE